MKLRLSASELLLAAVVVGGIGVAAWQFLADDRNAGGPANRDIVVPAFAPAALAGRAAFDANCARCHGASGTGTAQGPPLLNDIYNPGHHPDAAFRAAVRQGVRQHHWPFGDMPAQPQVTDEQLLQIVRYMRELQVANGIVRREHRM